MKKKTFKAGMNVGSSSILVTFVLLCIVTFAALSFVSANADNKLAKQTAERISDYYIADNSAEVKLANIDGQLRLLANDTDETAYFNDVKNLFSDSDLYSLILEDDDILIHYEEPISDSQKLSVTLRVIYPESEDACAFEITEWQSYTTYIPQEETIEGENGGLLF